MNPENKTQNTGIAYPSDANDMASSGVSSGPLFDPQALTLMPYPQQAATGTVPIGDHSGKARRMIKRGGLAFVALLLVSGMVWVLVSATKSGTNLASTNPANDFDTTTIPLSELAIDVSIAEAETVAINGSLSLNGSFTISPSLQPASAQAGQIYYDKDTNQLAYYNGSQFVALGAQGQVVQSVGGVSGQLDVGNGLGIVGNQLVNAGVTSFGGQVGGIALGSGLIMGGNVLQNNGVLNVIAGSNISVTSDGSGNYTVNNIGAGTGTVTSGGGTAGRLALFTGAQNIEDSIVGQSGLTVTITGDLSVVTGGLSLSNALTVSNGGTGATSLAANGVIVGNGTSAFSSVAAGGAGLCLLSTAGAPTWGACPGGVGVSSLNSLTGALTVANASGAGNTITIDDATTVSKGIASFNGTNFSVAGGAVNTIQNINTGASPTFAGVNTNNITPSAALTVGDSAQTLVLQGDGGTVITATSGANTTTVGFTAPTADVSLNFPALAAGVYDFCTTSGNCLGGSGGGANVSLSNLTGVAINTTLLPGSAGSVNLGSAILPFGDIFLAGTSGTPGTNNFRITGASTSGTRTITLPNASGTVCIDTGNCAGVGGGVTTSGGTIGTLPVFTAGQVIGDSLVSQVAGTVTVNGHLSLSAGNQYQINGTQISSVNLSNDANLAKINGSQTFTGNGNAFQNTVNSTNAFNVQNAGGIRVLTVDTSNGEVELGIASALDGKLVFNNVSNANAVTIVPGTPSAPRTITLPDDSGIVCLDSGNCAGAGATLQTAYTFSAGGTTPKIKVDATRLGVDIQDADTTIAANLFNVRASNNLGLGQVLFGVGNTGNTTIQTTTNSTSALRLLTDGGTTVLVGDTQNGQILLGQSSTLNGTIVFNNSTNANQITLSTAAASAPQSITLPNASGTVCLTSGNCAGVGGTGDILQGGNSFTAAMTIGTNDAFDLNLETSGVTRLTVESDGSQVTLASGVDLALQGANAYITNAQGFIDSESFGNAATVGANGATSLGAVASAGFVGSIAIGAGASTTAANQLVIGGVHRIGRVVIGNGVTNAAPQGFVLQGTSGSGTDVAGANVDIAGGQSTGNALGGGIAFQISPAAASGSGLNSLLTVATIGGATGAALFQNAADTTQAFRVNGQASNNIFVVDTLNARAGIALGANNTPTNLSGQGLEINGAISLTGSGSSAYWDGYSTPLGANLQSRLNIDNESFGASGSAIYVGLLSTSDTTSRGITVLDARATAHQPSVGVISPNESQIFGLSWDGSNTDAYLKNSGSNILLATGGSTQATVSTSSVTLATNIDLLLQGPTAFISNAQGITASEFFGLGATFEPGSTNDVTVVGAGSKAGDRSVSFGSSINNTANDAVAIGYNVNITSAAAIAIGSSASAAGEAIALGVAASAGVNSIALGAYSATTASNQLVIGSNDSTTHHISHVVIGSGVTDTTPNGFTLQGTSGSGSNVAGASATIAAGQGTGSALGGSILFQSSVAGVGGASLNGLTTLGTLSTTSFTLGTNLDLLLQGATAFISNPQAQTDSESFGLNATVTGTQALAVGRDASSIGGGVALGYGAVVSGDSSVAVGYQSTATGWGHSVAIGLQAYSQDWSVAIGEGARIDNDNNTGNGSSAQYGVAIGLGARATSESIAIGYSAVANSLNQLVIGGDGGLGEITHAVIGNGATSATPLGFALQGTSGSGADVQGADVTIASGQGTGSATGGDLRFSISAPGVSGSSLNPLTQVFGISGATGGAVFQNAVDSTVAFQIQDLASASLLTANTLTRTGGVAGNMIKIGDSTGTDTATTILQLDGATANPTTNLASLNGGMFYNSTTNKISLIENGVVKIICNTTDLGCGTGTVTLQNAYTNSTGGTTSEVIVDATRGALDVQDRSTTNGGTIGASLFNVRGTAATDATAGALLFSVGNTGVVQLAGGLTADITTASASSATAITLQPGSTTVNNGTGAVATIKGGDTATGTCGTACNGGSISIQGGSATNGSGTRNGGAVSIEAGTGNTSNGAINIGTNNSSNIIIGRTTGGSSATLQAGTGGVSIGIGGVANTIQIGNLTGAVAQSINIGSNATASSTNNVNIGSSVAGTTAITGAATITNRTSGSANTLIVSNSTSTGNIALFRDNATAVLTLADGGAATFQNQTNSASGFRILNSGSGELLGANTTSSILRLLNNNNADIATGGWVSTGTSFAAGRFEHGSVAWNGYLYVVAGDDNADVPTNTVFYAKINADGTTGTWGSTSTLPQTRTELSAVVSNGYIYAIGGRNSTQTVIDTVYYAKINADGTVGAWNSTTNLANARTGHTSVVANGFVYVVGGSDSGGVDSATTSYAKINADGTLGNWSAGTAFAQPHRLHASVVANGYLYAIGGVVNGVNSTEVDYIKLNTDGSMAGSWSTTNTVPVAQENAVAAVLNGYVYYMGGTGGGNDAVAYAQLGATGATGTWTTSATPLTASRRSPAAVTANGYMYVTGGEAGSAIATSEFASPARVTIGGSLDLVGLSGENLAEGGSGGQLTAGDTHIAGMLTVTGAASFKDSVTVGNNLSVNVANNTTSAFAVINAAAVPQFSIDTTNSRVYVGNPTADTTGALLVLDTKSGSGDPAGVDGAMYYNSNYARLRCYFDGKWRFCNDPPGLTWGYDIKEDFITESPSTYGELMWNQDLAGTGAGINGTAADVASRLGQVTLDPGTTTTGHDALYMSSPGGTEAIIIGGGEEIEMAINIPNLATVTDDYFIRVGLCDESTGAADCTDGVYLEYNRATSANWITATAKGGARTKTTTGTAVGTGWMRLKMAVNAAGTQIDYYVNGTNIGNVTTNIPNATANASQPEFLIRKTAGTTSRTIVLDYWEMRNTFTTPR